MGTAGKDARLLVLIAVAKGIVSGNRFAASRRIVCRPIIPLRPLTY